VIVLEQQKQQQIQRDCTATTNIPWLYNNNNKNQYIKVVLQQQQKQQQKPIHHDCSESRFKNQVKRLSEPTRTKSWSLRDLIAKT